jgi:hypothetical protein
MATPHLLVRRTAHVDDRFRRLSGQFAEYAGVVLGERPAATQSSRSTLKAT